MDSRLGLKRMKEDLCVIIAPAAVWLPPGNAIMILFCILYALFTYLFEFL